LFIGHIAVGFAAKRATPKTSLGVLVAAPLFLDIIWPVFLQLGWERVRVDPGNTAFTPLDFEWYPWSHSLVMALAWSAVFAFLYWSRTRYRPGMLVVGAAVFSHWVFDWITHRADLPLWPGDSVRVGLSLWNYPAATVVIETLLVAGAIALYLRTTRARDWIGRWGLAAFIGVTYAIWLGSSFGPPPPNAAALAATAFGIWLFPVWAWWVDRHRVVAA
jgi:membrane-bound metal-dependent hydrolase YbcI (DUF457 family)